MTIKLKFFGAAQNVTGSCYLMEAEGIRLLVDCGLYQERDLKGRNWDPFPVPASSIDAVLLTHAHLDHCGRLPKLVKEGFKGKIYCTHAAADLAKIILMDSGHLQEEDASCKFRRHQREGRKGPYPEVPLYTAKEAEACFPLFSPVNYGDSVFIGEHIQAMFCDAGHILGSAMIRVRVGKSGEPRTLLFSGDTGRKGQPILQDPTLFHKAHYVIIEATYGERLHDNGGNVEDKLADVINDTVRRGGNVVIPAFAVERSQELLYHLNELLIAKKIPPMMVFLDSPMAVAVTEVFENHEELFDREMMQRIHERRSPFEFPGLVMVKSTEQSKAINFIKGTSIIIAGAGMVTGGRIKHHLVTNITRPESTILFVGYQADGTLGREIVNGLKEVRIIGQMYPVKAKVMEITGFSSHADRQELLTWISNILKAPRQVFVTHGEEESTRSFADFLREKTGWKVSVPRYGEEVVLD